LSVTDPIVNALTATSGHTITIASPEKHSNTRVQCDMELWDRIKDYDKRAA